MPKPKMPRGMLVLPLQEWTSLKRTTIAAHKMAKNAASHGSINPRVKSKKVRRWLGIAVERRRKGGSFIVTRRIRGKTYQVTYKAYRQPKTGDLLVHASGNEMLGERKLGKTTGLGIYHKSPGGWVKVQ